MGISVYLAKEVITDFCKTYPSAYALEYKVRENQESLYGSAATPAAVGKIKGGFSPAHFSRDGEFHRGRCDIPSANLRDDEDLKRTLRHEVIGHFGINTFAADEKKLILSAIIDARNQPGIKQIWDVVERDYSAHSTLAQAEEVFAFTCESIEPSKLIVPEQGIQSLSETCITNSRLMQLSDLIAITELVADGMHDRSRVQQIFPQTSHDQFRVETQSPFVELDGQRYAVIDMNDLVQQNRRSIMGKVLAVEPDAAYTKFGKDAEGRDQVVAHHPAKLDVIPALGSFASINYGADGLGKLATKERGLGLSQQIER